MEKITALTEREVEIILKSAILGGATDKQCEKLIEWATRVCIEGAILKGVLTDVCIISVRKNGEPRYEGSRPPDTAT